MKMQISLKIPFVVFMGILIIIGTGCDKEQPSGEEPEPASVETQVSSPKTDDATESEVPAKEEPPAVVSTREGEIIPLVGIGPVNFGMSKDEVVAALGEPDLMEGGGIAMFYPKSKGLSFRLDPAKGVREISCWSEFHPMPFPDGMTTYPGKTREGIGMNVTREQIIATYGQPDSTTSRGPIEFLEYNKLNAQFSIVENKLVSLRLRGG